MNDGRSRLEDECDRLAAENTRLRALIRGLEQEIVALMDNAVENERLRAALSDILIDAVDMGHYYDVRYSSIEAAREILDKKE